MGKVTDAMWRSLLLFAQPCTKSDDNESKALSRAGQIYMQVKFEFGPFKAASIIS